MSFYCSTEHGEARVKEGITVPEEVLDKVFEVFSGDPNVVDDSIFLSYEDGWHEDLQLLAPYITEGEVEFSGEDSQHFRYVFPDPEHPDSGEWSGEQQSRIVWDGETGFTSEENSFIKKLLSRTAGSEARNMLEKYSRSFGTDADTDDKSVSVADRV